MKLVILSDSFLPRWDGVSRFLKEVIPYLKDYFDITAIVPDFGKYGIEGVKIERVKLSRIKIGDYQFPKFDFKIGKIIRESDVVFSNTPGPISLIGVLLAKKYKKPVVHYMHSIDWELASRNIPKRASFFRKIIRYLIKLYIRFLFNKMDVIAVPYKEPIEILNKNKIYRPEKAIVRLGVDTNSFSPPRDINELRAKIGIPKDKIIIGYIGRISREKGIELLLDAFDDLNKDFKNIHLLVVGKGVEGIIKRAKLMDNATYINPEDDIVDYMKAIDVFVQPSYTETTSLVTLEAMSCEKIVIVSGVGYMKNYVGDKHNGFIFPRGNKLVLKMKLKGVIENFEKYRGIGKSARKTVMRKFNWENTKKEIKELLMRMGN